MLEEKKIKELYEENSAPLFRYILNFVRSRESAEDILHDAFVRLIKYSETRDPDPVNLKAFLYKTAKNICIDYSRRNKKIEFNSIDEVAEPSSRDDTHEKLEFNEISSLIESSLRKAGDDVRSVFYMKRELGLGYDEISKNLGISERTAKRRMAEAVSILSGALAKKGFIDIMFLFLAFADVLIRCINGKGLI